MTGTWLRVALFLIGSAGRALRTSGAKRIATSWPPPNSSEMTIADIARILGPIVALARGRQRQFAIFEFSEMAVAWIA